MANDLKKENWINEALNAASGIRRAYPAAGFYERVIGQINQPKDIAALPGKHWLVAAVLLFTINIASIAYTIEQSKKTPGTTISGLLLTEIQTGSTYNY